MHHRRAVAVLLCLITGLVTACSPEPEAHDVSRSDLVGRWYAGGACGSSLVLEEGGLGALGDGLQGE